MVVSFWALAFAPCLPVDDTTTWKDTQSLSWGLIIKLRNWRNGSSSVYVNVCFFAIQHDLYCCVVQQVGVEKCVRAERKCHVAVQQ